MNDQEELKKDESREKHMRLNSKNVAFSVIVLYVFLGFSWILTSDYILDLLIIDEKYNKTLQSGKGVFFVLATGVIFYFIINLRIQQYVSSLLNLAEANEELQKSYLKSTRLENELYQLAYYDPLTLLPNRVSLEKSINEFIQNNKNTKKFAFMHFDIDDFRHINEMLGHLVGDNLLKLIGEKIKSAVSESSIVARLSGDEYVVAVFHEDAHVINDEIQNVFNKIRGNYVVNGEQHFVTVSAGVVFYPVHGNNFDQLLRSASVALAQSKANQKDKIKIFNEVMAEEVSARIQLSNHLRNAITKEELFLHYQPVVNLETKKVKAVEVLIRWNNPILGNVAPLSFIPIAEMNGQIHEITEWVFKKASEDMKYWPKEDDFKVSINLSAVVLSEPYFTRRIERWIERFKINPNKIILEITETAFIKDFERSIFALNQLRARGFQIALDDFGTGYSSLTYLQQLPIDIIKIDRSFIKEVVDKDKESFMLKSIVDLANHLKLSTIAEGIETKENEYMMIKYKIDDVQGYYYCRPLPLKDVIEYINQ